MPGFSYGVMKDGKVLTKGGYGYRDVEKRLPADEKTLYGIASCSKSFNSCLIAMLVDDGLLDYDKPIREYIPEFEMYDPFASKEVTLRDMLTHRTGLAPMRRCGRTHLSANGSVDAPALSEAQCAFPDGDTVQ